MVHHRPRLNQRRVPLLRLKAPHHHGEGGVGRDAELRTNRLAASRLIEALQVDAVIDATDRRGVAPLGDQLPDDGVAHRNKAVDLGGDALQQLTVRRRPEAARVHGGDHVGAVPGALLHNVERGHSHNLGAVHVGMEHLRVERNESISQEFSRALITWLLNHFGGVSQALKAGHGAAVRERDDVGFVARWVKAQNGAHHALLCATVRTSREQLHHAQSRAVWERPLWRTAATVLACRWSTHALHSLRCTHCAGTVIINTSTSAAPTSYL